MTSNETLPLGWAKLTLGELFTQVTDRIFPSEIEGLPYIGLEHIERDTHRLKGQGASSDTTSMKSVFRVGDILYGRLRPNLNKIVIAAFDGLCSTDILVLRPTKLIDGRYLLQLMSTREFLDYAISRAKGINLPRLSVQAIMAYACPVPPLGEQYRILDALESYITSLRAMQQRLNAARRLVADLPPRVLAAAANGLMTEHWRAHRGVGKWAQPADDSDGGGVLADETGVLPTGWISRPVGTLGTVKKGRVRAPEHHHGSDMRPYLRVANVLEDRIDTSDVMSMNFTPAEFERFRLCYGDILLNEGQSLELVGRPAMFRGELDDVCFTNSLIQFRCGSEVDPEFAILIFRHYLHAGVFSRVAKITTNLAHLGAMRFAALPFPVPPIDEQAEIAKVGRARLVRVEHLQTRLAKINEMLIRFDALIRARALGGRLVPQDESDRPVSEAMLDPTPSPDPRSQSPIAHRRKAAAMKAIISLTDALGAEARALTGQQLFSAAGYPDDATSELVERFYLELRQRIIDGRIERTHAQDLDMFALTKSNAA